jgi:hypothetical protein
MAQQEADTSFLTDLKDPAYKSGTGPVVMIDAGHNNFHTKDGGFLPFAELMRADGYRVGAYNGKFDLDSLKTCDVLVIANASSEYREPDWRQPMNFAFTDDEIKIIKKWVENGGSLFLIADHMPFPSAAENLAEVFGFVFVNCYAVDTLNVENDIFRKSEGTLKDHVITDGIDSVVSFTGQAFTGDGTETPLMVTPESWIALFPKENESRDSENIDFKPAGGWLQGAVKVVGDGKIAVFGEAAMFTAQKYTDDDGQVFRFGLNHPVAVQNIRFAQNIMRWLAEE